MSIVMIPTPLRKLTNGQTRVKLEGVTVAEVIDHLDERYHGIKEQLFDNPNTLRKFVNIYVNGEDIRYTGGVSTHVKGTDEISVVPAVAGGI